MVGDSEGQGVEGGLTRADGGGQGDAERYGAQWERPHRREGGEGTQGQDPEEAGHVEASEVADTPSQTNRGQLDQM